MAEGEDLPCLNFGREPEGYWKMLQNMAPEPLITPDPGCQVSGSPPESGFRRDGRSAAAHL